MQRIPEPELMEAAEQAAAYAAADFEEPNSAFVARLLAQAADLDGADIVDLGCGPGDIAVRLCRALPAARVTAVDGSAAMLAHARSAAGAAGLAARIRIVEAVLPGGLEGQRFGAVISNSLLHHLHDPDVLWREVKRLGAPGAVVLVADLMRPVSREAARALVEQHAAGEAPVLRRDFFNSLLAAFTVDEVRAQLERNGLGGLVVEAASDRHLAVSGRLP